MSLDQGRATVDLMEGPSIFLSGGQSLLKNPEGVAVHSRLDAPHILTSRPLPTKQNDDLAPTRNVSWRPVPGAAGYKIEISSRLTFDWDLKRIDQVTNQLDLSELSDRGTWFMRIHALDEYGLLGKPSIVLAGESSMLKMGAPP